MTGNELNEIREDGKEFAELAKKIPKEKKREALRLLEGFLLCAEYSVKKAGQEEMETWEIGLWQEVYGQQRFFAGE